MRAGSCFRGSSTHPKPKASVGDLTACRASAERQIAYPARKGPLTVHASTHLDTPIDLALPSFCIFSISSHAPRISPLVTRGWWIRYRST